MIRRCSTCGVSVFDVLDALRLVRVWEPVLAHEKVVAKADGTTCNEED